jgi:hypothetical protein
MVHGTLIANINTWGRIADMLIFCDIFDLIGSFNSPPASQKNSSGLQ